MTQMEDREHAFETKYANDQETLFKIEACAVKLIGLWAAQEMGMDEAGCNTYAAELVSHNLKEPGLADVTTKISRDLATKGKPTAEVDTMLARFLRDAETQIRT